MNNDVEYGTYFAALLTEMGTNGLKAVYDHASFNKPLLAWNISISQIFSGNIV